MNKSHLSLEHTDMWCTGHREDHLITVTEPMLIILLEILQLLDNVYHTSWIRGCPYNNLLKVIHDQRNQVVGINDSLEGDAPDDGLVGEDPDGAGGGLEHLQKGQGCTSSWVPHPPTCLLSKYHCWVLKSIVLHLVRRYLFEGIAVNNKVLARIDVPAELESSLILFPEEQKAWRAQVRTYSLNKKVCWSNLDREDTLYFCPWLLVRMAAWMRTTATAVTSPEPGSTSTTSTS